MGFCWVLFGSFAALAVISLAIALPLTVMQDDPVPEPAVMSFSRGGEPLAVGYQRQVCPCVTEQPTIATDERAISNAHFRQVQSVPDPRGLSSMVPFWGQFIDHDIVRSEQDDSGGNFSITMVPSSAVIALRRNVHRINDNGCRESRNFNTPLIDATTVYGDTPERLSLLRENGACKLTTSAGNLPPLAEGGREFVTGDPRGTEHSILASLHTLWMREHNRLCDRLAELRPSWSEEQRFWKARHVVIAKIQHITYAEWLPALFGSQAGLLDSVPLKLPGTDIAQAFSVGAYRFGHSMIPDPVGAFSLPSLFFNAPLLVSNGPEPFLMGAYQTMAQKSDPLVVDGLRDFLFAAGPSVIGEDLVARNLFRVREVGLGSFDDILGCYGEPPAGDALLEPYLGLLQEPLVAGSSLGRTTALVLAEQFRRLRAFDPGFYMRSSAGLGSLFFNEVIETTLASVIEANTALTAVPEDVFYVA